MSLTIGLLLALSFLVSLLALAFLIWAVTNRQLQLHQGQAYTVFTPGEAGTPDDATMAGEDTQSVGPHHYDTEREGIDAVSRRPVMILIGSGITWLVIGSIFGLMASLKLHWPDWLTDVAPLTFGRVRTLHLNLVIYGWLSMTGIGVALWIAPRIFHTELRHPRLPVIGAVLRNIAVACGALAIASGWTDGEE